MLLYQGLRKKEGLVKSLAKDRIVKKQGREIYLMTQKHFYLDYAATTPLDPAVLEKMLPYFSEEFGNPSSVHSWGQQAENALETAREMVASCLNAEAGEIVFTGCGTESDNLALRGVARAQRFLHGKNHILTTPVEHHAVSHTAFDLAKIEGFEVELLPVDSTGMVDPDEVARRIRKDTAIVSVIYANNEIGTVNPIAEIGKICREKGVPFHTDAVQAAAHLKMDVQRDFVDLLSIGAHKFYGPKGVGALYIRKGIPIQAVQTGGKQENYLRAGTHNVPYIVGLAEALRIAQTEPERRAEHFQSMRDSLIHEVLSRIPGSQLTGHPSLRLPNHASFVFDRVDGNALLMMLDVQGFACSSGSACKTGSPQPSEVLLALGIPAKLALSSLRVTLGRDTTSEALSLFVEALERCVAQQRK